MRGIGTISRRTYIVLSLLFVLTACATPPEEPRATPATFAAPARSDLQQVWQGATVALPVRGTAGSMITTNDGSARLLNLTGAGLKTRWPVILLLPGCRQDVPVTLMKAFAEQGYVVIAPDSQGRHFEPLDCGDGAATGRPSEALVRARQVEIRYARNQLQTLAWPDRDNLFLVGLYDGAAAAARFSGPGFKGRVLAEWDCQGRSPLSGIAGDATSPVFAVTSANVPTHGGDCGSFFAKNSQSQVLVLPQLYTRNILLEPIVYTQMLRFLDRQMFK